MRRRDPRKKLCGDNTSRDPVSAVSPVSGTLRERGAILRKTRIDASYSLDREADRVAGAALVPQSPCKQETLRRHSRQETLHTHPTEETLSRHPRSRHHAGNSEETLKGSRCGGETHERNSEIGRASC